MPAAPRRGGGSCDFLRFVGSDAQRRLREAFESVGRDTDTGGVVLELRRRDNGQPLGIQWWSRPDPGGNCTRTMFVDITERVLMERDNARLEAEKRYLQEEIRAEHNYTELVGQSPALVRVFERIGQVAPTNATVLIPPSRGSGPRADRESGGRRRRVPAPTVP